MSRTTHLDGHVVFRVAAGPRCGFGHLVRCRSLAHALGVEPRVSVRGTVATRAVASSLGWKVIDVASDRRLAAANPALLVVDDPSASQTGIWVQRARRLGIPVATIHDLGRDHASSDLVVDGSVGQRPMAGRAGALVGPRYAILHPVFATIRKMPPQSPRVLIALGGGAHVLRLAGRLCREISRRAPDADIRVARGFVAGARESRLPAGRWVSAPDGLAAELSQAAVAVVAGGVTLYEACALGVPVVGLAVTAAQHQAIRDMVDLGALIDGGPPFAGSTIETTGAAVARLLTDQRLQRRYARTARTLVDGRGALRVAQRLRRLMPDTTGSAVIAATKRGTCAA